MSTTEKEIIIPKTDVIIHDRVPGQSDYHVSGVPQGLATIVESVTRATRYLAGKVDMITSPIGDPQYTKYGSTFYASILGKAKRAKLTNPILKENMRRFLCNCVSIEARIGTKYNEVDLKNSTDIWGLVSKSRHPILGFVWYDGVTKSNSRYRFDLAAKNFTTCADATDKLNAMMTSYIPHSIAKFVSDVFGVPASEEGVDYLKGYLDNTQSVSAKAQSVSLSANKRLTQYMMINAINDAAMSESEFAMSMQKIKFADEGFFRQSFMSEIAPKIVQYFLMLMIAIYPFVILFALMPGGMWSTFRDYTKFMLMITTSEIMFILTRNIFIAGKGRVSLDMTLANASDVIGGAMLDQGIAGILYCSSFAFTYILFTKSQYMLANIMQSVAAPAASMSSAAAEMTASGNVSLANSNVGNSSFNNTSANKWDTNAAINTGHMRMTDSSGVEYDMKRDGTVVSMGGAGRTVSVGAGNLNMAESMRANLSEQVGKSESVAHSASASYSEAASQNASAAMNFVDSVRSHSGSNESYNVGESSKYSEAASKVDDAVTDLSTSFNLDRRTAWKTALNSNAQLLGKAVELATGASGGISYGGGATANDRKSQSILEKHNFAENYDTVQSAARNENYLEGINADKSLADNFSASEDARKTAAQDWRLATTRANEDRQVYDYSKSNNVAFDKNMNQEFLGWMSTQEYRGKGEMGPMTAHGIFHSRNTDLRDIYASRFMESQQTSIRERLKEQVKSHDFSGEEKSLGANREDLQSDRMKDRADIEALRKDQLDSVQVDSGIKDRYENRHDQQHKDHNEGRTQLKEGHEKSEQRKAVVNAEQNLIGSWNNNFVTRSKISSDYTVSKPEEIPSFIENKGASSVATARFMRDAYSFGTKKGDKT